MSSQESLPEYQALVDVLELHLSVYAAYLKDKLNVGITIFPDYGGFDFIYSDKDKNPLAVLSLGKVKAGQKYPAEALVAKYPGGVFDLSIYVKPEARQKGIAKELTRTAETFVGAVLRRDGIQGKALLSLAAGIPPEENELLAGLSRLTRNLGYDEVQDRLFLKEVDPTV